MAVNLIVDETSVDRLAPPVGAGASDSWFRDEHAMDLLTPAEIDKRDVVKTFGYRRGASVLVFLVFFIPIPLIAWAAFAGHLASIAEWPWWVWLLAGPVFLMAGLLWLVVVMAMSTACVASFRTSNWLMKVTRAGVYVKFRSYLNYHFPEDGPTVVYLCFGELNSARKTYEAVNKPDSEGVMRRTVTRYLDLLLKFSDTEGLNKVIAAETARIPPKGRFSSSRFHHVPVRVAEPGVLRVNWRGRKMLETLRPFITIDPPKRTGLGYNLDKENLNERIAALLERGEVLAATKMARDGYQISLKDARDFVRDLSVHMAQPLEKPTRPCANSAQAS